MATCKVTAYGNSIAALSRRLRTFSTNLSGRSPAPSSVWEAYPLPGTVTSQFQYTKNKVPSMKLPYTEIGETGIMRDSTVQQKQLEAMRTAGLDKSATHSGSEQLECVAIEAPALVKKDFLPLFPTRHMNTGPMTVLTVSQKTEHDMAAWSQSMEMERDALTREFVETAGSMCEQLRAAGYWADFIDPASGRPYLGPFTHDTLVETDERYMHLGLRINDLGCCKVIEHAVWGTHAFVGTIFTDAPMGSQALSGLLAAAKKC